MESKLCDIFKSLLDNLVSNPHASIISMINKNCLDLKNLVSEHFHECENCQENHPDEIIFPENWNEETMMEFTSVLNNFLSLHTEETVTPDELLQEGEDDEAEVRKAVQNFISAHPCLELKNWDLPEDFKLYNLYAVIESVSNLLCHHTELVLKDPETEFLLHSTGSVSANGKVVIPKDDILLEIARSAELWLYDKSSHWEPSGPDNETAYKTLGWLMRALTLKSDLLPCYTAVAIHSYGPWGLKLQYKKPNEQDDSIDRWSY